MRLSVLHVQEVTAVWYEHHSVHRPLIGPEDEVHQCSIQEQQGCQHQRLGPLRVSKKESDRIDAMPRAGGGACVERGHRLVEAPLAPNHSTSWVGTVVARPLCRLRGDRLESGEVRNPSPLTQHPGLLQHLGSQAMQLQTEETEEDVHGHESREDHTARGVVVDVFILQELQRQYPDAVRCLEAVVDATAQHAEELRGEDIRIGLQVHVVEQDTTQQRRG
mmetsp:Transcript_49051/g.106654  ORF Transcript_49051/g.106654 Transcript_49051/m.106654 type:complete len:220 (+) Transcript_49051:537-1196(+)